MRVDSAAPAASRTSAADRGFLKSIFSVAPYLLPYGKCIVTARTIPHKDNASCRGNPVMTAQLADAELIERRIDHEVTGDSLADYGGDDAVEDDRRVSPARGIAAAVMISAPFWALVGFTIYLVS
jgi:hypothetical protein